MKISSIAVETSRSTAQSDSIVRQTSKIHLSYLTPWWTDTSLMTLRIMSLLVYVLHTTKEAGERQTFCIKPRWPRQSWSTWSLKPKKRYEIITLSYLKSHCQNGQKRIIFIKMTAKSKFSLGRLTVAPLVKISFMVFRVARLIFTGQTNHLDMVYPWQSSFFRTSYLLRDYYTRRVMSF